MSDSFAHKIRIETIQNLEVSYLNKIRYQIYIFIQITLSFIYLEKLRFWVFFSCLKKVTDKKDISNHHFIQ